MGWVHCTFWATGDLAADDAPGLRWRHWSERVERTSTVWTVRTLASRYRLDLREGTFVRTELQGGDCVAVESGMVPRNELPGDATPVRLWAVLDCRVNEPMVLMIDLVGDGRRGTFRVTTPVAAIHPGPGDDEGHV
jgi:hypothetical protein